MKKTLYIFQNGQLRRKDNSLVFEGEQGKKYIPVENTNDIYIFGEIDVTKKFLEFVSQKEIVLHFFNHHGYYTGTYYPREHLNAGHVIVKQVEHYIDPEKRLILARLFVKGSLSQMARVLKYYRTRIAHGREKLEEILQDFDQIVEQIALTPGIEELMACEGHAREKYYSVFDLILNDPDFVFERRSKRPPHNRLNSLISFGNSILYTLVLSEIYKTYLDPRIGYLHTTNFRRFTLNLDVAEIFKPIFVDRVIFTLINKKMLKKKHFDKTVGGILLNEEGKRIFIKELEDRLLTTVNHRHLGKNVSNRRLMRLELYKLQKHFLGESDYQPYEALW